MSRAIKGCGMESPNGYRCTHHKSGEHLARGVVRGSLADAWPINSPAASYWREYDRRCLAYEAQGMTRSDAQGTVDIEYPMPAGLRP
jgi:hypothetical protein